MRPIVRGDWPQDEQGNIIFHHYSEARGELIHRLGEYCSYCEMHLDASLAVEHVRPKKPPGSATTLQERDLDWHNFLLACQNCNACKSNTDVNLDDYLWPDRDNTYQAFRYLEGGLIQCREDIQPDKASQLISLVGLDKIPHSKNASDRRWQNRRETWDIAERSKDNLRQCSGNPGCISAMQTQIVETAKAKGFWSVWLTQFQDQPEMLKELIKAFPGTCIECFEPTNNYAPIPRPGGQC